MGKLIAIDGQPVSTPKRERRHASRCIEDRSARFLLAAVNKHGQCCWFIRLRTTGLYERRFGPFRRRSDAIKNYDYFLEGVLQTLCDVSNRVSGFGHELVQLPVRLRPKGPQHQPKGA